MICCDFIDEAAASKQAGKGQGWACSKTPPFLPSHSMAMDGYPEQAHGAARTHLKPAHALIPSAQRPCHQGTKGTITAWRPRGEWSREQPTASLCVSRPLFDHEIMASHSYGTRSRSTRGTGCARARTPQGQVPLTPWQERWHDPGVHARKTEEANPDKYTQPNELLDPVGSRRRVT